MLDNWNLPAFEALFHVVFGRACDVASTTPHDEVAHSRTFKNMPPYNKNIEFPGNYEQGVSLAIISMDLSLVKTSKEQGYLKNEFFVLMELTTSCASICLM